MLLCSCIDEDPQKSMSDQPPSPEQRGVELFKVSFSSAMSEDDLALLALMLELSIRADHDSPGFARLDHYSGLFLIRGSAERQWKLEARTWGHPASQSIHEWHVLAAGAAHLLDPSVSIPERLTDSSPPVVERQVGHAANKRFSALRRRMVGVR
jgi:hypothetical protein